VRRQRPRSTTGTTRARSLVRAARRDRFRELDLGEDDVAWELIEETAVRAAELLLSVFEREGGRKGRLSIQTNPKYYRDGPRPTEQALRFSALAPNMQVMISATHIGLRAIEDATDGGVSINATVCFTVRTRAGGC
jgi:transaldolase